MGPSAVDRGNELTGAKLTVPKCGTRSGTIRACGGVAWVTAGDSRVRIAVPVARSNAQSYDFVNSSAGHLWTTRKCSSGDEYGYHSDHFLTAASCIGLSLVKYVKLIYYWLMLMCCMELKWNLVTKPPIHRYISKSIPLYEGLIYFRLSICHGHL